MNFELGHYIYLSLHYLGTRYVNLILAPTILSAQQFLVSQYQTFLHYGKIRKKLLQIAKTSVSSHHFHLNLCLHTYENDEEQFWNIYH